MFEVNEDNQKKDKGWLSLSHCRQSWVFSWVVGALAVVLRPNDSIETRAACATKEQQLIDLKHRHPQDDNTWALEELLTSRGTAKDGAIAARGRNLALWDEILVAGRRSV